MCIAAAPMAVIGMVASAASTAVSVMGAIQQGKAAQAQANYQAQVSQNNAQVAQWQAADAIERGKRDEAEHRQKVARMIGTQRAGIAGSGFELGDLTSQDILGDTAAMGEIDALTIRTNAKREAWGYEVGANNYMAEAGLQKAAGKNAKTASYWSAGGDLLSGASKFGANYADNAAKFGWGTA